MKNHFFLVASLLLSSCAYASIFGAVRGIVHDPQHRPVVGAEIELASTTTDWKQSATTDQNGEFTFQSVPLGKYAVTVNMAGFAPQQEEINVASGTAPVVHLALAVAAVKQEVGVSAQASEVDPESSTTRTAIGSEEIARTPGADRANSLSMITDYVPSATMVHDQLHIRGGHQVTWLIDGVPVPNTNIASNVGPQFDPKNIEDIEVQRGGYSAEFGDRTYGVFNVVTRSGFERNRQAEIAASYGSFNTTDDELSFGDHTEKFAYFASIGGNRTDLGLETPEPDVDHDLNSAVNAFTSLIYNPRTSDQLRFVASVRRDHFQVPNTVAGQQAGTRDHENERDVFTNFTWLHTLSHGVVFTLSPFYHYNRAAYTGGPNDFPLITDEEHGSAYYGGVADLSWLSTRNNARAGIQGFGQSDSVRFGLTATDGSGLALNQLDTPKGSVTALYAEDQFKLTSWFTINAGMRFTHYSADIDETQADPRIGGALRIPKIGVVLRAFYGRYYQAPPLTTVSGPIAQFAISQGVGFLPLHGETDEQNEFGAAIPVRGWTFDFSRFVTHARNFFDHDVLGGSNIFLPLTIDRARIHGLEAMVKSPKFYKGATVHLAFSRQYAEARGGVSGGLTGFSLPSGDYFFLDHDQRDTLSTGFYTPLHWQTWLSGNLNYGSGFLDGDGPAHLPSHTTVDFAVGKSFGDDWSAQLSATNIGDQRFLLDNSNTFGGTHFADPRRVEVQLKYRFHY